MSGVARPGGIADMPSYGKDATRSGAGVYSPSAQSPSNGMSRTLFAPQRAPALSTEPTEIERQTWAARFGWIAGGLVGLVAGFALTWLVETRALESRGRAGVELAATISGALVPGCFLLGALLGHAFGLRGGPTRYRLLGGAAGLGLAVLAWALLVVTR
jgi:hypothetical protein